jgi:cell division protein FtsQ
MDRSLAPFLPLRARSPRRRARSGRALRWRLPRQLHLYADLARGILRALWRRRRLRVGLLVLAVLAALLSAGWVGLRHSSLAAVTHVQITGVRGPDAAAIEAALGGAARRMSTLDVHLGALRAAVAPFATVRDVRASSSFPHTLRIHVIEQLPIAALAASGTRTAVAADGVVLGPALVSGSLPTLATSLLPAPGTRLSDGSSRAALAVLAAAPAPLARRIARAETGSQGITLVMRGGLSAYFGDTSRPHAKWLALALVLANERSAGASYIDVRVPERPAAGYPPGTGPPSSGEASQSNQPTTEAGGTQASIAAALAAGLAKAVGQEQASGSAAASAEPRRGTGGSSEAGTSAAAESGSSARAESGSGAGAEATPGAAGGH